MVLRQWKRPLTFLPRPLGDMFCKSEGLIQSGTHILSYCADSFAIKVCPPIGLYRLPRIPGLESDTGNPLRPKVLTSRITNPRLQLPLVGSGLRGRSSVG